MTGTGQDGALARVAAAIRPYLPHTYSEDEVRAVAEVALAAAVPTRDGQITDDMRKQLGEAMGAVIARMEAEDYSLLEWHRCEDCRQPHEPCPCSGANFAVPDLIDAALAAVAPDIAAAALTGLSEWRCPSCGAVTRARMADHEPVSVTRDAYERGLDDGRGDLEWHERRVRQECAAELRALGVRSMMGGPAGVFAAIDGLIARWSGSGRAPADEEAPALRWWHALAEDRPFMDQPDECRHGAEDERRWICRAGKVVYRA